MATRFKNSSQSHFGVDGLPSGYGAHSSPSELTVPPVGVEDVDAALFNLFNKELPLQVSTSDKNRQQLARVPVIFAAGEKWALAKRTRAIRDRNGSLILPLVTVVRTTIQQVPEEDITGRGINQQTGEIVIKRRLDNTDRSHQNLINRLLLPHQASLAMAPGQADVGQLSTSRVLGDLSSDPIVEAGGLLLPDRRNNVYETLVIPSPQFFTAVYTVTLWTQYSIQMFQLLEGLIASFLPQGNAWRLDSPKGYWFVATVDGNLYNTQSNTDDMSSDERIIKYTFTVKVPGYVLATAVPGTPIPIKRYVSSPSISFDVGLDPTETTQAGEENDFLLGADDPTLPLSDTGNRRRDQRYTTKTRLYPGAGETAPDDPALRGRAASRYKKITWVDTNGKLATKYVRVVSTNAFTGETVFAPDTDLGGLTIVLTED